VKTTFGSQAANRAGHEELARTLLQTAPTQCLHRGQERLGRPLARVPSQDAFARPEDGSDEEDRLHVEPGGDRVDEGSGSLHRHGESLPHVGSWNVDVEWIAHPGILPRGEPEYELLANEHHEGQAPARGAGTGVPSRCALAGFQLGPFAVQWELVGLVLVADIRWPIFPNEVSR